MDSPGRALGRGNNQVFLISTRTVNLWREWAKRRLFKLVIRMNEF